MTGADLVNCRKRLGMTQVQMATALGCGRTSLHNWETEPGRRVPKYIGLACAALSLGIREYPSQAHGGS